MIDHICTISVHLGERTKPLRGLKDCTARFEGSQAGGAKLVEDFSS